MRIKTQKEKMAFGKSVKWWTSHGSYLGVKFRQLLFINVSLGVDTSLIAELKHKNKP